MHRSLPQQGLSSLLSSIHVVSCARCIWLESLTSEAARLKIDLHSVGGKAKSGGM